MLQQIHNRYITETFNRRLVQTAKITRLNETDAHITVDEWQSFQTMCELMSIATKPTDELEVADRLLCLLSAITAQPIATVDTHRRSFIFLAPRNHLKAMQQ